MILLWTLKRVGVLVDGRVRVLVDGILKTVVKGQGSNPIWTRIFPKDPPVRIHKDIDSVDLMRF